MKTQCLCLKCGHKWTSRVSRPASCPACKRYDWFKKGVGNRSEYEEKEGDNDNEKKS